MTPCRAVNSLLKKSVTECSLPLPIMFFSAFIIFDKWFLMGIFSISVGLTKCRAQHCQGIILHSGLRLRSTSNIKHHNLRIEEQQDKIYFITNLPLPFVFPVHGGVHKMNLHLLCKNILSKILTSELMSLFTIYFPV